MKKISKIILIMTITIGSFFGSFFGYTLYELYSDQKPFLTGAEVTYYEKEDTIEFHAAFNYSLPFKPISYHLKASLIWNQTYNIVEFHGGLIGYDYPYTYIFLWQTGDISYIGNLNHEQVFIFEINKSAGIIAGLNDTNHWLFQLEIDYSHNHPLNCLNQMANLIFSGGYMRDKYSIIPTKII